MAEKESFLGATKHLYNWLCPSVGLSVGRSVTHSFDDQHVAPYWPTWPCLTVGKGCQMYFRSGSIFGKTNL